MVTPGQSHDVAGYEGLMPLAAPRPRELLGDKAFDSDDIRDDCCFHGTDPLIPTKKSRTVQYRVAKEKYRLRSRIEHFFNRLKEARRIATRYEKTAQHFLGFIRLVSIRLWIKFVNRA